MLAFPIAEMSPKRRSGDLRQSVVGHLEYGCWKGGQNSHHRRLCFNGLEKPPREFFAGVWVAAESAF
jgi:hypothetical protein